MKMPQQMQQESEISRSWDVPFDATLLGIVFQRVRTLVSFGLIGGFFVLESTVSRLKALCFQELSHSETLFPILFHRGFKTKRGSTHETPITHNAVVFECN
jgi:hypothetical protein